MRITQIETLNLARGITCHAGPLSWLWVRLHTDSGLIGLGETYPLADASEAVVHSQLAPLLLGRDPRQIDRLWADMKLACETFGLGGVEMRAISAVDLALWDLLGKLTGQPVWQRLGGRSRDRIRTYNTCYDHLFDFNTDAGPLARSLLEQGIRAMKIWPFDRIAIKNGGQFITAAELDAGLEPIRQIRESVGVEMEIALEFHGYWNLPCAVRIARAVEPYQPLWLEEMMPQDNLAAYRALKQETRVPLILSERLMTRWQFREALQDGLVQFVNPDICWCGGLSEAKRIAALAETGTCRWPLTTAAGRSCTWLRCTWRRISQTSSSWRVCAGTVSRITSGSSRSWARRRRARWRPRSRRGWVSNWIPRSGLGVM